LLYASGGDRAKAAEFAARAVTRAEQYASGDAKSDLRSGHLAEAYLTAAAVHRTFGDWDEAGQAVARALAIWRGLRNPGALALYRKSIGEAESLVREVAAREGRSW